MLERYPILIEVTIVLGVRFFIALEDEKTAIGGENNRFLFTTV